MANLWLSNFTKSKENWLLSGMYLPGMENIGSRVDTPLMVGGILARMDLLENFAENYLYY